MSQVIEPSSTGIISNDESKCATCGSSKFEGSDGLFFCIDCGTQSQDVREEDKAELTVGPVRTYKSSTVKKKKIEKEKARRIPYVEKIQLVLKLQCEALIRLGFDDSVKEAVQNLSLIYLKHFGYAFQGEASQADPSHSVQATPTSFCTRNPPRDGKCTTSPLDPVRSRKRRRPGKRLREEEKDSAFSSEAKRARCSSPTDCMAASCNPLDSSLPSDSLLFEDNNTKDEQTTEGLESGFHRDPDKLHIHYRRTRKGRVSCLSIRLTLGLVYLGLLFSKQNLLLADLSRWIATNQIPFHNLHRLLPPEFTANRMDICQIYGRFCTTADKIHGYSFRLWKCLPLPPLPPVDVQWMCHTLIDRLSLPQCVHVILNRTLATVFLPCQEEELSSRVVPFTKRADIECMALVVVLLKMLYRLDGEYEFKMAAGPTFLGEEDGESLYVWEDWVAVFCRAQQKFLERNVPVTARELEYVGDYKKYLEFCRDELFPKVRPAKADGGDYQYFNPHRFPKVAAIFSQHLKKTLKGRKEPEENMMSKEEDVYNWDSFVPRRISLKALELEDGTGPWSRYLATPDSQEARARGKEFKFLSDSMVQLLQLCSDLISVKPHKLLLRVKHVEWTIIFSAAVPVAQERVSSSSSSNSKDAGGVTCRSSDSEEEHLSDGGSDSSCSCCCSDCSRSSIGSFYSGSESSDSDIYSKCSSS